MRKREREGSETWTTPCTSGVWENVLSSVLGEGAGLAKFEACFVMKCIAVVDHGKVTTELQRPSSG